MNTSLMLFLAGFLIGWLLEWVIDWFFWRRNSTRVYEADIEVRAELDATRQQLDEAKRRLAEVESLQQALDSANGQVEALRHERTALQRELTACKEAALDADNRHADTPPAVLAAGPQAESPPIDAGDVDALQAELDALRQARDELQQSLQVGRYAGATTLFLDRDDLEQIDGIGPIYEERLYGAGVETFAQLAQKQPEELAEIVGTGARADFERWIAQAEQFAATLQSDLLTDDLEEINGIGSVYAKRLRAAGIASFANLAQSTTEQLAEVVGKGRTADYESWIAQAKVYAALVDGTRTASDLERIKGIGPVFAARLEVAGITTFAALSRLGEAELQQIIGSKGWGLVHYDRWITQARLFADQESTP